MANIINKVRSGGHIVYTLAFAENDSICDEGACVDRRNCATRQHFNDMCEELGIVAPLIGCRHYNHNDQEFSFKYE